MGHLLPGTQDTYYDKTKIEEMREKYAKLVFEPGPSTQELSMQMLEKMAHAYGIDVEKLLSDRKDMLRRPLSLKEREETILGAMKRSMKSGGEVEQRVVSESEAETLLSRGWRITQASLRSGRVVVEKPTPNHITEEPENKLEKRIQKIVNGETILTENKQESPVQVELEKPGRYSLISYLSSHQTENEVSRESKHKAQPDNKQGYAIRPKQESGATRQTQFASYSMSQGPQVGKIDVNQEILSKGKSPISDTNRLRLKSKDNVDLGLFL